MNEEEEVREKLPIALMIAGSVIAVPGMFLAFRASTAQQVGFLILAAAGGLMIAGATLRRASRRTVQERRDLEAGGTLSPVTPHSGERAAAWREWRE